MGNLLAYSGIVTKIRAMESKLLKPEQFTEIANLGNVPEIVDYLKKCDFEQVVLVGDQFAATRHSYETYADAPALIKTLKREKPTGKTILIKGSNGIRLNTLVPYL